MNHIEFLILVLLKLGLNDMKHHIDLYKCTTTLLYQNIPKVWTPNCFIRENSSRDTPSTASLLAISVLIRETSCSAVDRTKSKVPGNAEGCGSPVIMMETHGVGRGGMIVNPKSFHPKRCWNTTKIYTNEI